MREERSVARESVPLTKADTDVMTVTDKETPEQIQRVHLAGVHFGFGCLALYSVWLGVWGNHLAICDAARFPCARKIRDRECVSFASHRFSRGCYFIVFWPKPRSQLAAVHTNKLRFSSSSNHYAGLSLAG
jgi:hypothetical protein